MKTLHVSEYCHAGTIGGTERYILDLIRLLAMRGEEQAILWLFAGDQQTPFEAQGVHIVPVNGPPRWIQPGSKHRVQRAAQDLLQNQ